MMKRFYIAAFLLCTAIVAAAQGPVGAGRFGQMSPGRLGLTEEGDQVFTLKSGEVTMTVNASKGGKIMSLKYQDKEVLSQSRFPEAFGSTFWTSPQKEWNWPPVAEFDKQAYTIERQEPSCLTITSPVSQRLGCSVSKDFQAESLTDSHNQSSLPDSPSQSALPGNHNQSSAGAFTITYSIRNEGSEPRRVAPWEITRVTNADGLIFFEAPVDSIWPQGLMTFEAAEGAAWYKTDEAQQNRKVNADGTGWLAYMADGLLLVKKFPDLKPADPAPGEAEIQVYVNRGKSYIELESQGAYTLLRPGERLTWTVRWFLLPAPSSDKLQLLKVVRSL